MRIAFITLAVLLTAISCTPSPAPPAALPAAEQAAAPCEPGTSATEAPRCAAASAEAALTWADVANDPQAIGHWRANATETLASFGGDASPPAFTFGCERGFLQMAEMVNWSRLSNGVKSTALMRRALHDAFAVARGRKAFGKTIIDLPLARRQLLKLMLPLEQALSLCFITADALDRAERPGSPSQDAAALLRILTPVLKFRSTRDARKVCGDALEFRGGIGYVEEFAPARLLRDAHLGSIWEGTSNIVAIDAITRAIGKHSAESALAADLHARISDTSILPGMYAEHLKRLTDRAIAYAQKVARDGQSEADARRATSLLYHTASAVTLAWDAGRIHARRGDASRLLLSRLVIDHKLTTSDPFAAAPANHESAIAAGLLGEKSYDLKTIQEIAGSSL